MAPLEEVIPGSTLSSTFTCSDTLSIEQIDARETVAATAPAPAPQSEASVVGLESRVFHRQPTHALPLAVSGTGPYLIDKTGKFYLDASGGAAVSCLGHNHPAVVARLTEQIQALAFAHTGFFTNQPMEELAHFLTERAPGDETRRLERVYFVSGGSEAVEAALKLAHQFHLEAGEPHRDLFIARRQSYHGNTLGALSVGGNEWRRAPFKPLLRDTGLIDPCYPYRYRRDGESLEAYGERSAAALEETLLQIGPERVSAFVAETVGGATAGALTAAPGYFKRIREICDRYGMLLILDEVMCGMGRTGTLFAYEQEGVTPDLVTIAKGLGGGYQPIGAVLATTQIYEQIRSGSGFFQHGHTYMGHAAACAASLAVQQVIEEDHLLTAVQTMGARLRQGLVERFGDHPHVGDIRGRGLFLAMEFVADRATKEPFDPGIKLAARLKARALEAGLMCYPNSGTIDGRRGDHVLLAPPFIIGPEHVDEILDKLSAALTDVLPPS